MSSYSKIEKQGPVNSIKTKLNITNYIFCYNDKDLNNANLEYWFDTSQNIELKYENGKQIEKKETFKPVINFLITAFDENKESYTFDFMIQANVKDLNKLPTSPILINEYVIDGEIFFKTPNDENSELIYINNSIYSYTPTFWLQKIEDNKFVFKIQYQNLFIWFDIKF